MKPKKLLVTVANDPLDSDGLASSIACRVVAARCVIDDPRYETWEIKYVASTEATESVGTPATLISTANRRDLLYWNGETWKATTATAARVLDIVTKGTTRTACRK